jgi:hypothetical protein
MYYFGKKETGLLIPGSILTALGAIFLLLTTDYSYLWPATIIVVGIILILKSRRDQPPPTLPTM